MAAAGTEEPDMFFNESSSYFFNESSSYDEVFANVSTAYNENGTSSSGAIDYPFDIPECPAGSILRNFYHFREKTISTFFYTQAQKFLISVVIPVIFVVGLLTNSAFLVTIARVKAMKTITNFYLANLACADLTFIIITGLGYTYANTKSPNIRLGTPWKTAFGCAASSASTYITYFASICLVSLVGMERFMAICYPLRHRMINRKPRTVKMVLITWLIAVVLGVIVSFTWGKLRAYCIVWPDKYVGVIPTVIRICTSVRPEFKDVASVLQFLPFIIALVANTVVYALIIRRLSHREINGGGMGHTVNNSQIEVRNAVARMLVVNGITFFLCLAPYQFFNLHSFVTIKSAGNLRLLTEDQQTILLWVGRCSSALNSAINPLVYSATNARYRQAFKDTFYVSRKQTKSAKTAITEQQ